MFDMMCCIYVDSHGNAFYTDVLLIHSTFLLAAIASNNFISDYILKETVHVTCVTFFYLQYNFVI